MFVSFQCALLHWTHLSTGLNYTFCCKQFNWLFHYIFSVVRKYIKWKKNKYIYFRKELLHSQNELSATSECLCFLFWFDIHIDYLINSVFCLLSSAVWHILFSMEFHYIKILLKYAASNFSSIQKMIFTVAYVFFYCFYVLYSPTQNSLVFIIFNGFSEPKFVVYQIYSKNCFNPLKMMSSHHNKPIIIVIKW